MTRLRLAFMGTPAFAVPTLQALIDAGHDVACVYTQPPRPAGRGKQPRRGQVHTLAEAHALPVRTPKSLKAADEQAAFADLGLDAAVVVAYGLILPAAILAAPRLGCLNVHASLLPRWRGAAPIHRAVMAGDAQTGVCIMVMDAGLDTGPVLSRRTVPIGPTDTTGALHDRLAALGARMIGPALAGLADGSLKPAPQPADGVTYAPKIDKAEAHIDWTAPAETIDRQVRGLAPFPGAWCTVAGERLKVLTGTPADGEGTPGTLLDDRLTVACGRGAYRIQRAQRAGKAAQDADALLRGFPVPAGAQAG